MPSFQHFFSTDVFLLQFIGASSMGDIFKYIPRRERWWEMYAFSCGITLPCFVLFCEFTTVYIVAKSDLNYMIEALTATFSGFLSIMKVSANRDYQQTQRNMLFFQSIFISRGDTPVDAQS